MRSLEYKTKSRVGRQIIMIGIIACLCLSAGEGLRLRPFPVYGLAGLESRAAQLAAERSPNHYLYSLTNKYSPLIAPSRSLKRGKQLVIHYDYGSPSSYLNRELTASSVRSTVICEAERLVFLLLISRSPSRAPPGT